MANNVATKPNIEKTFRRLTNTCKVCGYRWFSKGDRKPKRCASSACRSLFWKEGKHD